MDRSGKGGVVSNGAIAGATRKVERLSGAIVTVRAIGPRGGVCSAGDILDAAVGDHSRESNAIEYHQGSDIGHNSNLGFLESGKADRELVVWLGDKKDKSVKSQVEAFGSPTQQRVVSSARLKQGFGRPAKNQGLVDRVVRWLKLS
ncbi:hypothetical protein V6N12_031477 [Hibiscus sabdariffa]|uniref:Uncharacterized protein n=1 Tax=Hibiscus sabdariffa TaxID=183260 RepID=A0ABR2CRQ8_9ROSI